MTNGNLISYLTASCEYSFLFKGGGNTLLSGFKKRL